jgi:hypothetical protein
MQLGRGTRSLVVSVMVVSVALFACKKKKTAASSVGGGTPTPTVASKPPPEPVPPTPTQTFGLKSAAKLDGVTVTIEEFQDCRLDNFYSRRSLAKKKEKLVGANVVFEGNGAKDHNVSYTAFRINDSDGMAYSSTFRSGSNCNPTLKSGRIGPGEKTRGWVIFQVPQKASGFKLVLTNRRPYRTGTSPSDMEQKVNFDPK